MIRIPVLVVSALVLALPAAQAFAACATPEQIRAAQMRQFHDQLQVAALNCRADDPSMSTKWEAYVNRFGSTLSENARMLQSHFKSAAAFDRYNTQITNRESVRVHMVADFCETRAEIFSRAVAMNPNQFATLASETVGQPDHITACPAKKNQTQTARRSTKTGDKKTDKAQSKTQDKTG